MNQVHKESNARSFAISNYHQLPANTVIVQHHHTIKPQQPGPRGSKLPQAYTGLLQNPATGVIHIITLTIHDLLDADLGNLDTASETGASVTVQDGALSDALPAGLEQGVLLGVQTEAGGEGGAAGAGGVAALAAALVAVAQVARRAVVARRDDPRVVHQHAPDPPLHAVRPLRRQPRQSHEVRVPCRPQPDRRRQVQRRQERVVRSCAVE
jgi:hypothetical protein